MDAGGTRSMSWKLTWRNDGPRARNAPRPPFVLEGRCRGLGAVTEPAGPRVGARSWPCTTGPAEDPVCRATQPDPTRGGGRATGGLAMSRASLAIRQGPTLPITLSSGAGNGTVATGRKATGPSGS